MYLKSFILHRFNRHTSSFLPFYQKSVIKIDVLILIYHLAIYLAI
jgi:hypothetical protein